MSDPKYKKMQDAKAKAFSDGLSMKNELVLIDDNEESIEKELLRIDEELSKENAYYFK